MLTCYNHSVRLPQNDLAYLAFRLALQDTLSNIETYGDLNEDPDPSAGYLSEVPFLEQVPLPVQVDLLADAWARHQRPDLVEASLLDAAVVYAACKTAGRITNDMPEVSVAWLQDGPRTLRPRIIQRASHRLEELFEQFWDDRDFLLIEEFQDMHPDQANWMKTLLNLPDEEIEPMYAALGRWKVSPDVTANLAGLMTDAEIQEALPLLKADWRSSRTGHDAADLGDPGGLLTGLDDRYHGLMVGPCEPEEAEAEADCPLVDVVGVMDNDAFDCTYEEWGQHLRADVRQASQERASPEMPSALEADQNAGLAEQIQRAQTIGLDDGTRIKARGNGWVVVDRFFSYLLDPEDASWVVGDDDEEMPPAVFPTATAAYRAWQRSEAVGQERKQRREEALRRLGKG